MKKGKKQFRGPQPRPQQQPAAPGLKPDLRFYHASTVHVREFDSIQIVLAGCGGNGAWAAMHLARIAYTLQRTGKDVRLTLADPDHVKEENLGRQWFCQAEIGQPKAVAVAGRLGRTFGLRTMVFHEEYSERVLAGADLTVLVGCVDGPEGRRALSDTLRHNPDSPEDGLPRVWWCDLGNDRDAGRVLLGSAHGYRQLRDSFVPERKWCLNLPSPAVQYPSLLAPERGPKAEREMSCAEMLEANLQSLNINAALAVQASDMLTRLLVTGDLKRYACAVNVAGGSVRSYYVTPEEVAGTHPAGFLVRKPGPEAGGRVVETAAA
jgi:PRTRC genetic system ThiF family protein